METTATPHSPTWHPHNRQGISWPDNSIFDKEFNMFFSKIKNKKTLNKGNTDGYSLSTNAHWSTITQQWWFSIMNLFFNFCLVWAHWNALLKKIYWEKRMAKSIWNEPTLASCIKSIQKHLDARLENDLSPSFKIRMREINKLEQVEKIMERNVIKIPYQIKSLCIFVLFWCPFLATKVVRYRHPAPPPICVTSRASTFCRHGIFSNIQQRPQWSPVIRLHEATVGNLRKFPCYQIWCVELMYSHKSQSNNTKIRVYTQTAQIDERKLFESYES